MLRRFLSKWPDRLPQVLNIAALYHRQAHPGVYQDQDELQQAVVAPQPGQSGRHLWQPNTPHKGPIGSLCTALHHVGARIDTNDLSIHHVAHHPLSVQYARFQALARVTQDIAIRASTAQAASTRTDLASCSSFDHSDIHYALGKHDQQTKNITRYVASLGTVSFAMQHRYDADVPQHCHYCGDPDGTTRHLLWQCQHPMLVQARNTTAETGHDHHAQDCRLLDIDFSCLPPSLLLGIPSAINVDPAQPFWGPNGGGQSVME